MAVTVRLGFVNFDATIGKVFTVIPEYLGPITFGPFEWGLVRFTPRIDVQVTLKHQDGEVVDVDTSANFDDLHGRFLSVDLSSCVRSLNAVKAVHIILQIYNLVNQRRPTLILIPDLIRNPGHHELIITGSPGQARG
jgi:hypothetical protein